MPERSAQLGVKDGIVAGLTLEPPEEGGAAAPGKDTSLHQVVVVGGGAAGLELVTKLGDTLGRRRKAAATLIERARGHLWKPLLHEVAAGSLDVDEHELDYLAHAHWHRYRFRYGEMVGLDRARKAVLLAPTFDEEGREITPRRAFRYDTLVIAVGSVTNDFGTPGVRSTRSRSRPRPRRGASTAGWSTPASARTPRPSRCARASCTSRSSAPARPAPSSRPSCTAPPGRSSPTASSGSTRRRTSRSP